MNIKEDVEQHKIWLESYSQDGKRFTAIKQDLSKAKLRGCLKRWVYLGKSVKGE
jgi:hypothetical protein